MQPISLPERLVMKQLQLEFELFVVVESRNSTQLLRKLRVPGHYHFEVVPQSYDCTQSFVSILQKAHFSVLMVRGKSEVGQ